MLLEGRQIDRYHILRLLGSGGMGDVYLAEDPRIGQQVAVKVFRSERSPYSDEILTKDVSRLFQREAKTIVKLDHPHILPLYDYGEEQIGTISIVYLVMPYRLEGSLTDWLRRRDTKELLSLQDVVHIITQAADALQHAHDHNVIHQDVKPSNFLVRARKDAPMRPDLLLSDFGIARLSSATSSISQSVRGTPSYMAPEQWEGEPVPATDQYALAVMTYELLTGKLPFHGGPGKVMYQHMHSQPLLPSTFNHELSSDIDEVMAQALAKQPQKRFASISAFGNAFQQAVGENTRIQIKSLPDQIEKFREAKVPIANNDEDMTAPTLLNSTMQVLYSDSKAFDKPEYLPASSPLQDANVQVQQTDFRVVELSDTQEQDQGEERYLGNRVLTSTSSIEPRKKRKGHIVALALLVLALIGGGIAYATSAVTLIPARGHSNSTENRTPIVSRASTASISIVPILKTLQNDFSIEAITGTPDKSGRQYQGARMITSATTSYTQTAKATGQGTIPGTHASGTVYVNNYNPSASLTLDVGSIYSNTYSSINIHMVLDATVTVPPAPTPGGVSQRSVPGHILEIGTIGNNEFNNNINNTLNYSVFNYPFTNGKNPQTYTAVQQSDITNAANALINADTPDPQQVLQPQLRANERFIGTPQCNPIVNSNHQAGDNATSVTVSVSFTCAGEVYNYNGARTFAEQLLMHQAITQLGGNFAILGIITTSVVSAKIIVSPQGTVAIVVDAQGKWVYHFTDAQKQKLAKLIAGKKKNEAQSILLAQTGIAQATIQLTGGDEVTLPLDASKISIIANSATV